MDSAEDLEKIISPLIEGMGMSIVDCSIGRHRGDVKINLVLYRQGGIGIDDLTRAQKVLRPRLELEYDRDSLSVEIASPGISRVIKNPREYGIFAGRSIRLLIDTEWIEGTLGGREGAEVLIKRNGQDERFLLADIKKAKLD